MSGGITKSLRWVWAFSIFTFIILYFECQFRTDLCVKLSKEIEKLKYDIEYELEINRILLKSDNYLLSQIKLESFKEQTKWTNLPKKPLL